MQGCWVVRASWVRACLSAGAALPPDEHEVSGDTSGGAGGPRTARTRKEAAAVAGVPLPGLLAGFSLLLAGECWL